MSEVFSAAIPVPRTPSGIPGLDEILGGGFPQGSIILVLGEPGAGKTLLCSQYLANGIKFGESGLFVSLEDRKDRIWGEMNAFGVDLEVAEKSGKFAFVDASPIRTTPGEVRIGKVTIGKQDFSISSVIEVIRNSAKAIGAKRIVVDPISVLNFILDERKRLRAHLNLVEALTETGATCLLSSDLTRVGFKGRIVQVEEHLVNGVILMQRIAAGRGMERVIQIEKMQETAIDRHPKPYRITDAGIEVSPREMYI